ncbi:SipW-dependent-type signal peptide-containing protein [Nesterenkonia flava]|uniref:SipW-dependent-type signal peptide-containing protein n=1 Tax=Nesterenkonia flava TaxID=469799 RepID=A0ABU1FV95_9MICC|nr:SipW-dependent-type signal peptide-containing protein [Nesterenkonia flava]MDR5712584.1 SipW-dependent-type signal peptide-containing protein [Nesterenkonia flava]
MSQSTFRRRRRRRKVQAVLAAGSVLGVGAAVTLASWTSSQYTETTINAGTFVLEGAVPGGEFLPAPLESAHTLVFTDAAAMHPGSTGYAAFSVRTASGSMGGEVRIQAAEENVAGLGQWLTYGVALIEDPAACHAATFNAGTQIVPRGTAVSTGSQSPASVAPDGGSVAHFCLEITLPEEGVPNEAQGTSAHVTWEFRGSSVES